MIQHHVGRYVGALVECSKKDCRFRCDKSAWSRCEFHKRCDGCFVNYLKRDLCMYAGIVDGLYCSGCHRDMVEKICKEFDGDTLWQYDIVCPHCGFCHDKCNFSSGDGDYECSQCYRWFGLEVHHEFSTQKKYP